MISQPSANVLFYTAEEKQEVVDAMHSESHPLWLRVKDSDLVIEKVFCILVVLIKEARASLDVIEHSGIHYDKERYRRVLNFRRLASCRLKEIEAIKKTRKIETIQRIAEEKSRQRAMHEEAARERKARQEQQLLAKLELEKTRTQRADIRSHLEQMEQNAQKRRDKYDLKEQECRYWFNAAQSLATAIIEHEKGEISNEALYLVLDNTVVPWGKEKTAVSVRVVSSVKPKDVEPIVEEYADYPPLDEEDLANLRALNPQEPMAIVYGDSL